MGSEADIERILWTEEEIAGRVAELAAEISDDLIGAAPPPLVFVGVATGAFLFLADLVRRITLPLAVDFVRVESYGSGTESNGAPKISSDLKIDIRGKHVVLVPISFILNFVAWLRILFLFLWSFCGCLFTGLSLDADVLHLTFMLRFDCEQNIPFEFSSLTGIVEMASFGY
ncbi:hypothetical protein GW17_00043996 [Ensete ventricosum]|nr:hypothetical protein GW17_00043996 [Ensete ventricosum]RZS10654.1 hypothetical protein BHM03_00041934 [Ensete ventricosum]